MDSLWKSIVLLIFGGIITELFLFFRRNWTGSEKDQKIARAERLLAVNEKRLEQNLEWNDLDEIEHNLLAKRQSHLRNIEDEYTEKRAIAHDVADDDLSEDMNQAEMNALAQDSYFQAQTALRHLSDDVSEILDDDEREIFDQTVLTWDEYASCQAKLLASVVSGGSMEPLIRYTELDRLTIARIAELSELFEERKAIL